MNKITFFIAAGLFCCTAFGSMAQKTKVIAHRGAWKNTTQTENSIGALKEAIKLKCFGSEFDVHMSSDEVLFVHHDHTINGIDIEKTTAAELSKIKLPNGEFLPTVEQYLIEGKKQNKTRLIFEIKTSRISKERSLLLAAKCVQMVNDLKVAKITDYIAFDYDVCKKVKELAPKAHVQYLNGDKSPKEIAEAGLSGIDYHFRVFEKNPGYIQEIKDLKLKTNVWTVNDETKMNWFIDHKVDMITTDQPELLIKVLKK